MGVFNGPTWMVRPILAILFSFAFALLVVGAWLSSRPADARCLLGDGAPRVDTVEIQGDEWPRRVRLSTDAATTVPTGPVHAVWVRLVGGWARRYAVHPPFTFRADEDTRLHVHDVSPTALRWQLDHRVPTTAFGKDVHAWVSEYGVGVTATATRSPLAPADFRVDDDDNEDGAYRATAAW